MKYTKESTDALRSSAFSALSAYIDSLEDDKQKRLLSYWIRDYSRFLSSEATFDPKKLLRYKRGSVVKVHLGYRVGSEEGGLHYAVVVDRNALSSPVATVIPLTSVKPDTDLSALHDSRVYLGDELYQLLDQKLSSVADELFTVIRELGAHIASLESDPLPENDTVTAKASEEARRIAVDAVRRRQEDCRNKLSIIRKTSDEISKMKHGSITLVGQITTVSKIRIYDPIFPGDVLSGIRLSSGSMDKLDDKLIALFTGRE